ncbi:MAG: serine/threonine-protein phosphatase [Planctomycetes bacterium]|nr:serine/threonine-protein phosphatase [Planctomycetota bacterium]
MDPFPPPPGSRDPLASDTKIRRSELAIALENLAAGATYQKELLPRDPPPVQGYDLGFYYGAARSVSGDFYDFIPLPDKRLGIAIADASGKGIPAGMLAMTCRAMLRAVPDKSAPPAKILTEVNRLLYPGMKKGLFLSGAYAVLDPAQHTLTVANAGHLPTVVWKAKLMVATTHPSRSPVLGLLRPEAYEAAANEEIIPLEPGDRFVMITDGVNESMAPGQKQFGMEHLRRRLKSESGAKSADFLKSVIEQIDIHRAGGEQSDDITVVTGRRLA